MTRTILCAIVTVALGVAVATVGTATALAANKESPVKEILSSHIGAKVNETTGANICTIASKNTCKPGAESSQPGSFSYPEGIAAGPAGNVYIADRGNHRVQELTATGQFVLAFGDKVNKKGGNVCRDTEESECQGGEESSTPGGFQELIPAIAVDPVNGDIYVADLGSGDRIQKFTADGGFVFEIGKDVNEATGGNLCTQKEVEGGTVKCKAPAGYSGGPEPEPGAFVNIGSVAVGGPEGRLYVGDSNGVQEFTPEGVPVSEPAKAISRRLRESPGSEGVATIAIDNSCLLHQPVLTESTTPTCKEYDQNYGDIYTGLRSLQETDRNTVHRFTASGQQTEFSLTPRVGGKNVLITQAALDPAGRLAVTEIEDGRERGSLYEVTSNGLRALTEFAIPGPFESIEGMGFGNDDRLYLADSPEQEIITYEAKPVGELVAGEASCEESAAVQSNVTFDCALNGEVDPWGVSETSVWFQSGRAPTELNEKTPPQAIGITKSEGEEEAMVKVDAPIAGLRPNESGYYYELAGSDHWVSGEEELTSPSPPALLKTPEVPPRIVGEPAASYQTSSSAVLFGELNPENANTTYEFRYVPAEDYAKYQACRNFEEACPGIAETSALESGKYGKTATTLEAVGLEPATTYHYRLHATDDAGEALDEQGGQAIPEGTFQTAPAPAPQATTGASGAVGVSSATIAGAVDPDGRPATYAFELGLNNGADTQYGVVFSGPVGATNTPVEETLTLTGLQPGTSYAYRITIESGYGTATGATQTFTTAGVPQLLAPPSSLPMLEVPKIDFPQSAKPPKKCALGYARDKHGKCVKSSKAKKKQVHKHPGKPKRKS